MMQLHEIKQNISECAKLVIAFAEKDCLNSFTGEVKFIKNIIRPMEKGNTNTNIKAACYKLIQQRAFVDIDVLAGFILKMQENISWVDIQLACATEEEIIMIVNLVEEKSSDMLKFHCGYMVPFEHAEHASDKTKFDINWWLKDTPL